MSKSRFILCIGCFALILSACAPKATAAPATPTESIQALPQTVPTRTPGPTATPLPTKKPFLTPTLMYVLTSTVPVLYTAAPGTETAPSGPPKILVYDDIKPEYGLWVKETVDKMGLEYTYANGSGDLLKALQADIQWDLIILASEDKAIVQGELWEIINAKVTAGNSSLIAEAWNIDLIYEGKIKLFLNTCGVTLSKSYNLKRIIPIYINDPLSPIFNTPNANVSLLSPVYFWDDQAVDYLKLLPNSAAKILASGVEGDTEDNGVIVSCISGRVILQTFLNHDFPEDTIKKLWENYITYMLQRRPKSQ